MSRYDWFSISTSDDYDMLVAKLDDVFQPLEIVKKLKSSITRAAQSVLIEHDYVDKDYRSTFYHFYAKKGRPYRDDCVRLHFFDEHVTFDLGRNDFICADGRIEDHYFGYLVLRPTVVATLGRSILSPNIRSGARGAVIQSRHRVHLLGYTLTVWGFPSMAQHIDIAVCAHVSCWAILRHYSERFSQHREILIYDITKLAQQFDPGGLTPSFGLHILEAERVFQAAGSFPLIVVKQDKHDVKFYAQLLAYLESGFPLYVGMSSLKHAVVAAGYAWRPSGSKQPAASSHVWSQVDAIIAVDDNHLPYGCVFVGPLAASGGSSYTTEQFDSFIVPLPEKIYYSAEAIEAYSVALCQLLRPVFNLPADNELQRRYFITTISALRRYAREFQSQLGDELVNLFMLLKTAQFVWVVEYASVGQWEQGHVAARAIIDATASPRDPLPVWFAHDHDNAILFDRSKASMGATMLALKRPVGTPLGRMEQNLRPVKARP